MAPESARRFPPASRLTRTADLEAVRRDGKRFRTTHVEVRFLASLLRHPRVGLIVPKHKQTAVARNRVKRRLRECARLELLPALRLRAEHEAPLDVVLRAAPSAYQAGGPDLCADVRRIAARLGGASGAMSGAVSGAVSGAAGRTTTGTAPRGAS